MLGERFEHVNRDIVRHQSQVAHLFREQSTAISHLSDQLSLLSFTEVGGYSVQVEGHNLEKAIDPLRLMNSRLAHALETISDEETKTITQNNAEWFVSEVDRLMRFAYLSCAPAAPGLRVVALPGRQVHSSTRAARFEPLCAVRRLSHDIPRGSSSWNTPST